MGGGRFEVEVDLLHTLPVVPLGAGQSEQPLLEDGVLAVPQGEGEAEASLSVRDPEQPVLPPAVDPAARMIVGEIDPWVAVRRVILPDRPPLPLGEVGPPTFPVLLPERILAEAGFFSEFSPPLHGRPSRGLCLEARRGHQPYIGMTISGASRGGCR